MDYAQQATQINKNIFESLKTKYDIDGALVNLFNNGGYKPIIVKNIEVIKRLHFDVGHTPTSELCSNFDQLDIIIKLDDEMVILAKEGYHFNMIKNSLYM